MAAPAGRYVATAGATSASACLPGSYQPAEAQTSCLLADPGYYVPGSAAIEQLQCPAGTTSAAGATECTPITTLTIAKQTNPAGASGFPFLVSSDGAIFGSGGFEFVDKWGTYGSSAGEFYNPYGAAVDAAGNVYISDQSNSRIQKFDNSGNFLLAWGWDVVAGNAETGFEICTPSDTCQSGAYGAGNGQLSYASGLTVDGNGNVYVADASNNRIQKFDSSGNFLLAWGWDVVSSGPNDNGTGFEVCTTADTCQAGADGSGDGQFSSPNGVATDGAGDVFVVDTYNHRVQKFDSAGAYLSQWGVFGSGAGEFGYPEGVATDGAGNVYVADTYNNRIQKFDGSGGYLTQWGVNGSGSGEFSYPQDVAADGTGHVYVADTSNNRIQKFDGGGNFLLAWGWDVVSGNAETGFENCTPADTCKAGASGSGDGQFNAPNGVAADTFGNVYVADSTNQRIQKFGPQPLVLDDGQSHDYTNIPPGTVEVTELVPAPWTLANIDCGAATAVRNGDSVSVTLTEGEHATCTFTNSGPTTGTIVIAKDAVPADDTVFSFTDDIEAPNSFALQDPSVVTKTFSTVPTGGSYTVTEVHTGGWPLTALNCSAVFGSTYTPNLAGGSAVVDNLAPGDTVTCTFTNTQCQPGNYDDGSACVPAPSGRYVDTAGATSASDCQPGTYQPVSGQTSCRLAAPGYYVSTSGATEQLECPAGTTSAAGATECTPVSTLTIAKQTNPGGGTGFPFVASAGGATLGTGAFEFLDKWGANGGNGTWGTGAGEYNIPYGVAADASGNVYVADRGLNRIQKLDSNGNFLLAWGWDVVVGGGTGFEICTPTDTCKNGTTGGGAGQFNFMTGVAVDAAGNVYVAELSNHRIQKFDSSGNFLLAWGRDVVAGNAETDHEVCTPSDTCKSGSFGGGNGQLYNPRGVAVDAAGNVYVAEEYNHRIQKFDSNGNFLLTWGWNVVASGPSNTGTGLEVCTPADVCQGGGYGSGDGQFWYALGVAADATGSIYVTEYTNHRVQKFAGDGAYLGQWGSSGSGDGQFLYPYGLAVDGFGNVFVADTNNNRVQMFAADGTYLGQWGAAGSGDGEFNNPHGVAVGAASNVYVTDYWNNRVQKFGPLPVVLDDTQSHDFGELAPGTYEIAELVPDGWTLADIDCGAATAVRNGDSVSVTLASGDNVTCTFTNSDTTGPAALVVNTAADTVADDGSCSLREAIAAANTDTASGAASGECAAGNGADTITFAANYTITLVGSQLPLVTTEMTISGNGAANTIIEANAGPNTASYRVFEVDAAGSLTLDGVTVRHGNCSGSCVSGGGIYNAGTTAVNNSTLSSNNAGVGGGIFTAGGATTTVLGSMLSGNSAVSGGGIHSASGAATSVTNSTLSGNSATSSGGGIDNVGTMTVTDSTLSNNTATGFGGGIFSDVGTMTVTGSTLSGNSAGTLADEGGGGIYTYNGATIVINSTLSGNSATDGGGIYNYVGTTSVTNSTLSDNTASANGGGIRSYGGTVTLSRSVVSGNRADAGNEIFNFVATVNSNDYSVFGHDGQTNAEAFTGSLVFSPGGNDFNATTDGTPAALASILVTTLGENGGPTQTHALVDGSPAVDFAPDADCSAAPVSGVDQRGQPRNLDGSGSASANECDSGAFELNPVDRDADSVDDAVEAGAPNGGDGNNDGLPDSQQANVSSLPNSNDGSYLTLVAPAGSTLVDVAAVGNPSPGDAPAGVSFAIGFLTFQVSHLDIGSSTAVTLFLEGGGTVLSYWKYGPTPDNPTDHWYEFLYDGQTGAEILSDRVVLHFRDGARGDHDLTADGTIVDPGAPAVDPPAFEVQVEAVPGAGNDLDLSWQTSRVSSCTYTVYQNTVPYFSPPDGTVIATTSILSATASGVMGNVATNYFFRIEATGCVNADAPDTVSGTVGEFDFAITPGGN